MPWQQISAWAAGRLHSFRVKVLDGVLRRKAGPGQLLRLIIIAPLGYRLREGGRILYRQPAFLPSSARQLSVPQIPQAYLWRWGIEVNFRDQKILIGTGQARVRGASACQHQRLPAPAPASTSPQPPSPPAAICV